MASCMNLLVMQYYISADQSSAGCEPKVYDIEDSDEEEEQEGDEEEGLIRNSKTFF